MSLFYQGKKVLVTGGTGTIGVATVKYLITRGAKVSVVSTDSLQRAKAVFEDLSIFRYGNLRDYATCLEAAKDKDYVFHLAGVKGNTQIGLSKVATAYVSFLMCNTNMMEAAFRCGVSRYMFIGSIGQYPAIPFRQEDQVWHGPPVANDRYMGIAKRAGEAQAEAYLYEHGWDAVRIIRLSNVYGPYDDFDPRSAQVIPALISRIVNGENPLKISGDGTAVRDFIYLDDAVEGMLVAFEKAPACVAINIGSGQGYSIKEVVETIMEFMPKKPQIQWDVHLPTGDQTRILVTQRAKELLNFEAKTSLRAGIKKTIEWYLQNKEVADRRGRELYGQK